MTVLSVMRLTWGVRAARWVQGFTTLQRWARMSLHGARRTLPWSASGASRQSLCSTIKPLPSAPAPGGAGDCRSHQLPVAAPCCRTGSGAGPGSPPLRCRASGARAVERAIAGPSATEDGRSSSHGSGPPRYPAPPPHPPSRADLQTTDQCERNRKVRPRTRTPPGGPAPRPRIVPGRRHCLAIHRVGPNAEKPRRHCPSSGSCGRRGKGERCGGGFLRPSWPGGR